MFEITPRDQEVFDEVGKIFDIEEDLEGVEYIHLKKEVGWYIVTLFYEDGDVKPWLKTTTVPVQHIKRIKYYSGCSVFVEEGLLKELCSCNCKKEDAKYHQIGDTNYSRGTEGEFHSF